MSWFHSNSDSQPALATVYKKHKFCCLLCCITQKLPAQAVHFDDFINSAPKESEPAILCSDRLLNLMLTLRCVKASAANVDGRDGGRWRLPRQSSSAKYCRFLCRRKRAQC